MKKNLMRCLQVSAALLGLNVMVTSAATFAADVPMNEPQARAMLNRFGYGPTPASLLATTRLTPRQFLNRAITEDSALPAPVDELVGELASEPLETVWAQYGPGGSSVPPAQDIEGRMEMRRMIGRYGREQIQARLLAMANSDNPGHEVLLSFWLNHFSVFAGKGLNELLVGNYIHNMAEAMRSDSFEALLRASFFHPAMQIYLDNQQSVSLDSTLARQASQRGKRFGINENLARELLELHTLGVDAGYGQDDVQALARIITGAGVYPANASEQKLAAAGAVRHGYFLFDPRRHDFGSKHLLGVDFPPGAGLSEIDQALHLLAVHPSTAKHIATKLAQRFLDDEPPAEVIAAMAYGFLASDGRISATLSPLLESPAFKASLAAPQKFKEPLDYVLSVARAACGDQPIGNAQRLFNAAREMGQLPMRRTTPDGYGTQEDDWLSPIAMQKRLRFTIAVAQGRVRLATAAPPEQSGSPQNDMRQTCKADPKRVEHMIGVSSVSTLRALVGLPPIEQTALLLTSHEFMRR